MLCEDRWTLKRERTVIYFAESGTDGSRVRLEVVAYELRRWLWVIARVGDAQCTRDSPSREGRENINQISCA